MGQCCTYQKKSESTVFSQAFNLKFSDSVGLDWRTLGRRLNIEEYSLELIDQENVNVNAKAYSMLTKWLQMNDNPTLDALTTALIEMKRMDLIKIVDKFTKTSNSPEICLAFSASKEISNSSEISSGFYANEDLSTISAELKKFYLKHYGEIGELQPLLKASSNVDLMHKFVDLCIVDAAKTQMVAVFSVEQKEFFEKQMRYTQIPYSDLLMNKKSVVLVSGIAGIGKTWLLRKCLLDWSNNLIWKDVELVFYLECRWLNQYENISSINELISVFYEDVLNDFDISKHTALFIIDGLDEFKYFNELLKPSSSCTYPIVNALAEIRNYKHLVAGRVYAIDQYQSMYTDRCDKLSIQIMGFNENGILHYVESYVKEKKHVIKEVVKATLKASPIAKAMASVPFYLSSMCKIISDSKHTNSFVTMTNLYAITFLYFFQKHIIKNNEMIYQIMEKDSNKKYVLNICKIAFELLVKNKVFFSEEEFRAFVSDFDKNEGNFFGFIEKTETDLGCYYHFAHLTIMEFCASVYAYNCLSSIEIMANKKLESCLPMICGLTDNSQNSLLKFLVNLSPSKNLTLTKESKGSDLSYSILDCLCKSIKSSIRDPDNFSSSNGFNLLYECFYESQSSFPDDIKSTVPDDIKSTVNDIKTVNKSERWFDGGGWIISIYDGKTSYATSCDNYFVNYLIESGRELKLLRVDKNILSDEEKNLLIRCSTNVCGIIFKRPINFEGWKPKDKFEVLYIHISRYLITKNDFEENFLPWINLCDELDLELHDDINFIKSILKWIRCLNIKKFIIKYRKKVYS
ncbi:uncharacterized protein LOC136075139 [Hydra vulgaris]|uniref:Uncharacterized protein LOC136075139 n=1 Tax=Hydra vulgaris TaxID=6087 RepID=A0ABM4B3Y7_HYDVU